MNMCTVCRSVTIEILLNYSLHQQEVLESVWFTSGIRFRGRDQSLFKGTCIVPYLFLSAMWSTIWPQRYLFCIETFCLRVRIDHLIYSCWLSDLASEWLGSWSWPCFHKDLTVLILCKSSCSYANYGCCSLHLHEIKAERSVSKQSHHQPQLHSWPGNYM